MLYIFKTSFMDKVEITNDCWLWNAYKDKDGYGKYTVNGYPVRAHRYAYEQMHGLINENMLVLHKCDNPPCVNPEHLFIGTTQDNINDKIIKGRDSCPHGELHSKAKLTQEQVNEIRKIYKKGRNGVKNEFSETGLSRMFGVSVSQIHYILTNQAWKGR